MSKSLLLECDPIDQPAATDPIERRTWCTMRIRVGHRFVSRIWDSSLESERTNLYLPAFPIAEWLVENWWSLLNELCPWDTVPRFAAGPAQMSWMKRHCLRTADSALMLPALYLFYDGQDLRAEWHHDASGSVQNMPGEFVADGAEQLDRDATVLSLEQFINDTFDRVAEIDDRRVHDLTDLWEAILAADTEEQQFCTLAGRMGIDPYDPDKMTDELARFLEQTFTNPDDPLVRDLTEVAQPDLIMEQWAWVTKVSEELKLGPNPAALRFPLPSRELSPPHFGYELARKVRAAAQNESLAPLQSVEKLATDCLQREFRVEDRNHVPGAKILFIVGSSPSEEVVTAGPQPQRDDSRRFRIARSLYHALVTSRSSQRLVTDTYSWDQKASRAFAAELLAPQQALKDWLKTPKAEKDDLEELSAEFRVSEQLIARQLENAAIPVSEE